MRYNGDSVHPDVVFGILAAKTLICLQSTGLRNFDS